MSDFLWMTFGHNLCGMSFWSADASPEFMDSVAVLGNWVQAPDAPASGLHPLLFDPRRNKWGERQMAVAKMRESVFQYLSFNVICHNDEAQRENAAPLTVVGFLLWGKRGGWGDASAWHVEKNYEHKLSQGHFGFSRGPFLSVSLSRGLMKARPSEYEFSSSDDWLCGRVTGHIHHPSS